METGEVILRATQLIDETLTLEKELMSSGEMTVLIIDFKKILYFDVELAQELLDDFEECIQKIELAVKYQTDKEVKVRIKNIPKTQHKDIWKLRADDLNKLVTIKGFIRKTSDVLHSIKSIKIECPACANTRNVPQEGDKMFIPKKCPSCKYMGKPIIINKEMYDLKKVVLEEDPSELGATQKPRRMLVILKDDLCKADIDKKLQASSKMKVSGILKDKLKDKDSMEHVKYLEANYVEVVDESYASIKISKEEEKQIIEMSKSKTIFEDIAQSIIPTIYGQDVIKKAIALQLVGGVPLTKDGKLEERGNIHVFLIGSPGVGKSVILKRAIRFLPNSRFTTGVASSGVGLIAAVVKDEELGGFTLDVGAIPLANKGLISIDEMDKMSRSDISMMNNAMIDCEVTIEKASIHQKIETDTTILGAANPIDRVFDDRRPIWKQIGLPKDFMDRFDLIFPMDAMNSEKQQRKVANIIFSKYGKKKQTEPIYSRDIVIKYIIYAKRNIIPKITTHTQDYIIDNFINLVKPQSNDEDQAYFSSRLITNIIRIATAVSRIRLKKKVEPEDAKEAIEMMIESFKKQGIISGNGVMDIHRMEAVTPKARRNRTEELVKLMRSKQHEFEESMISFDDVKEMAISLGIEDFAVEEVIENLQRRGDIYEPRVNKYRTR